MADDPEGQELDITINFDLEGLENIQAAQQRIQEMQEGMNEAGEAIDETVEDTGEELKGMGDSADKSAKQFSRFTGVGLGLLFTMRALNQRFTIFTDKMLQMGGITDEVGGIMAGPLAEGANILRDVLPLEVFREFVANNETLIAKFLILGTAVTAIVAAFGMLLALVVAINAALPTLVGAGGIAGLTAAMGSLVAILTGPVAVAFALVLATVLLFKDTFMQVFKAVGNAFLNLADVVGKVLEGDIDGAINASKKLFSDWADDSLSVVNTFVEDILNIPVVGKMIQFGADLVNGIVDGIKQNKDLIPNAIARGCPVSAAAIWPVSAAGL